MHNINGPWEKNSFGYYPLDKDKKKPEEWSKVKDKLEPNAVEGRPSSPERDEFYNLSYAWQKTTTSQKFPAKMGKNSKQFLSAAEEAELNKLITEDKKTLLRHTGRLALLYKRHDAYSETREHREVRGSGDGSKSKLIMEGAQEKTGRGVYVVEKALNAIKSDGFRGGFVTVSLKHTDKGFQRAARIWEDFGHTLNLKVLGNFKALGQYLYYMISYKGQEKQIRIRVHKGKYTTQDIKDD